MKEFKSEVELLRSVLFFTGRIFISFQHITSFKSCSVLWILSVADLYSYGVLASNIIRLHSPAASRFLFANTICF